MAETTVKNVRLIDKEGNALYPETSVNQVAGLEEKLKTVANADDLKALSDEVKNEVETKLEHTIQESDIEQLKAGLGETVKRTETSGGATVDEMGRFFKSEQTSSLEPVACLSSMPQGILGRLLKLNGARNDFENVPFKFIDKNWFSENFGADDWSYFRMMYRADSNNFDVTGATPLKNDVFDEIISHVEERQTEHDGTSMTDLVIMTRSRKEFCIMSYSDTAVTLDYQTEGLNDIIFIAGREINYIRLTLRLIAKATRDSGKMPYYVATPRE